MYSVSGTEMAWAGDAFSGPADDICVRTNERVEGLDSGSAEPCGDEPLSVATEWVTRLGACVFDLKFYFCQ